MNVECEISIIIPTYNAQKYILRCLNSIKAQLFQNYEIIVIDDHSTDQTVYCIEEFITDNPQISCILIKNSCNLGHCYSRNLGIQTAKGAYVCTIDADDSYHPKFLLLLYEKIKETNAQFVFCGYDRCWENKTLAYESTWSYPNHTNITKLKFSFITSKTHICHCTILHNKKFLFENELYYMVGCRTAGDTEFTAKVLFNNPRFACVPQTLYYYHIHENSISTSSPSEAKFDGYYAYERVKNYIKNPLWKFLFLVTKESREVFHIIEGFYRKSMELPFLFCSKYKILILLIINAIRKCRKSQESTKILLQFYNVYFKKAKI